MQIDFQEYLFISMTSLVAETATERLSHLSPTIEEIHWSNCRLHLGVIFVDEGFSASATNRKDDLSFCQELRILKKAMRFLLRGNGDHLCVYVDQRTATSSRSPRISDNECRAQGSSKALLKVENE